LQEVLSRAPTTMASAIAVLGHLGQPQFLRASRDPATVLSGAHEWYDDDECELRAWSRMLAAALRTIEEGRA
jgi:hypothetical protein